MQPVSQNVVVENVLPDANGYTWLRQFTPDGETIVEDGTGRISAPRGPAGLMADRFVPTSGQTVFILTRAPGTVVLMFVNGVLQREGRDYTVDGRQVKWLDGTFNLGPTDELEVCY